MKNISNDIKNSDGSNDQQTRLNKIINAYFSNTNKITDRLYFIQTLLSDTSIPPMLDFNQINSGTEYFQDDINKKVINFTEAITRLGGKLLYIKSGTTGHTFKGIFNPDPKNKSVCINYAVKVVAYPKEKNKEDIYCSDRPENAELKMIKVLSQFVLDNQTPHIVLPIATFNTVITPFINLAKNKIVENKKYDQFVKKYEQGEIHNTVSVLISEWADNGDLLDYIRKNYTKMTLKDWRIIFFQLISVLAVIQTKYPSFRHNDMKANNILVQKINKRGTVFSYMVKKNKYYVPNIGYMLKLWDFDFACIPNVVDNSKVSARWTSQINIKPVMNRYYDMHYFFNTLIKKSFLPELMTSSKIPIQVKEFIRRVVPLELSEGKDVTDRGRLLVKIEYTTPDFILKNDNFFEEFRVCD